MGADIGRASSLSAQSVWAIGECPRSAGCRRALQRHGLAAGDRLGAQLSDILALARGNVWVSASRYLAHRNLPLLAHLNGTRWSRVQLPWRVDPGAMAPDGRGGL